MERAVAYGSGRVRVYIGSSPQTEIARKVLECSVVRRTDMQVDFVHMTGRRWEYATEGLPAGVDAYELRRWMIPAFQNWDGLALYIDAASLATSDVWDLWTTPQQTSTINQSTVWCAYRKDEASGVELPDTSVMLIDCNRAKAEWGFHIDDASAQLRSERGYVASFRHALWLDKPPVAAHPAWCHLDSYSPGYTRLIRYGNSPLLPWPWHTGQHPYGQPWEMELAVATHAGFVPPEILEEAVSLWGTDPRGIHPDYKRFIPTNQGKRRV